jgi:glycosyltransferase involved in cell wall biosynthesis
MKKAILLRAPVLTQSGYGVHSRQIFKALQSWCGANGAELHCELLRWGNTHWLTNRDEEIVAEVLDASSKERQKLYHGTVQVQLPNEWDSLLGHTNIGVTAGVETTFVNPKWVQAASEMSALVTPSKFTQNGFSAAANLSGQQLLPRCFVVPESYPEELLSSKETLPLNLKTDFNFLLVGTVTGTNPDNDRKNLFYTCKWFAEAFAGNSNVGLVVKTTITGAMTELDRVMTKNLFNQVLNELKKLGVLKENGPKIYLLHGHLTDSQMGGLYSHPGIKALLTFTRGEGFGLPILEAAVCGLPVIGTDWSAHTEFLEKGKWLPVAASLLPVHKTRVDNEIFLPQMEWANPSESVAKSRMLKFYESPEKPKLWGTEQAKRLEKSHSFTSIEKQWHAVFDEVF